MRKDPPRASAVALSYLAHTALRTVIPFPLLVDVSRASLFLLVTLRAEAPRAGASDIRCPAQWRYSPPAEGPLPRRGPRVAFAAPFAHALDIFLCVVAVAIAVARSGREDSARGDVGWVTSPVRALGGDRAQG
jgi:hypothetical protein